MNHFTRIHFTTTQKEPTKFCFDLVFVFHRSYFNFGLVLPFNVICGYSSKNKMILYSAHLDQNVRGESPSQMVSLSEEFNSPCHSSCPVLRSHQHYMYRGTDFSISVSLPLL